MSRLESSSNFKKPATSLDRWLARRGLRGNPFERWNAEHDRDLPNYFVDLGGFDDLLRLTEPCVVFAKRGCGKTAQRQMLAAHCRPLERDGQRLAVAYSYSGFEQALENANGDVDQVRAIHHVRALLYLGLTTLKDKASRDSEVRSALTDPDVESRWTAYIACFAPHLADASTAGRSSFLDELTSLELLEGFADLVKDASLGSCVVLVDGLDEFPLTANDPAKAVAFLAPLLGTLSLIECPGLAFKFFLPQELEVALRACRWFRADRLHIFRIAWNETNLLALIKQRLTHFSHREPPYEDLAQLCEDKLAEIVNDELTALAQGSPRVALILADMLLQSHCQESNPPELIALETWKRVEAKWLARRDDVVMGEKIVYSILRVEKEKGLVWLGERDITSKINPQDYRVLACLYQHQGNLCTKDFLIQQAWPHVKVQDAISDQAIAACIARLRRALGQSSPDEGYIETVRGRGYRLHPEGFG